MIYQLGRIILHRLRNERGGLDLGDAHLGLCFDRMMAERSLTAVFYDGSVTTRAQFLALAKSGVEFFFCQDSAQDNADVGFFWLTAGHHTRDAYMHLCFWRDHMGGGYPAWYGREVTFGLLNYPGADGRPYLDVVRGKTPATHRSCLKMLEDAGWTVTGRIAQACYLAKSGRYVDAIESFITRETWEATK